ncbi:MAG: DUF481 domain-containing protein [Vicinamibacterales bacterium]
MFPRTSPLVPCFFTVALAIAALPTHAFAQSAPAAPAESAQPADAPKQTVLRLKDNTLLMGHVVREDAETMVFSAGALGELTIKKSEIVGELPPATVAAAFQAPAPPAPPASNLGTFAPAGKVVHTRMLGAQGSYVTSPYVLGELDPNYPGLTGAALRLPGVVYSVQGQLSLYRTSDRDIVSLDASMSYAYADNAGEQADNPRVSVGYNRRIGTADKLYGLARQTWYRDGVRKIDFSNQTILGVGIKTINTPKVKLDLVPALSMQYDKKGTSFDEELLFGGGAMEVFQVMLTPVSMIEQKITAYRAFNESRYYGIESSVGFKGMVSKRIGFNITWAYNLDNSLGLRESPIPANTLFPGQAEFNVFANKRSQSTLSSGLLITF